MKELLLNIIGGLLTAMVAIIAKRYWPLIMDLFDRESRRQAKQISGLWTAREVFADKTHDEFLVEIRCVNGKVNGMHKCLNGVDRTGEFPLSGSYKDHILNFTWIPLDNSLLESGTVTAKLIRDKELEGHGLYIEPADGKIYTSEFIASKISNG